jgi:hypothetical protein
MNVVSVLHIEFMAIERNFGELNEGSGIFFRPNYLHLIPPKLSRKAILF